MGLADTLYRLGSSALDILFPPRCVGCNGEGAFLCPQCTSTLPLLEPPYCRVCAQPFATGSLCHRCRQRPLEIDGIRAPFLLQATVREAVHRLKYNNLRALAPALGALLTTYLLQEGVPADRVVPVPLHRQRLRQRGYNQAALLAQEVARGLGLPFQDTLVRHRATPPQARSATATERRANVHQAFTLRPLSMKGVRALLVDDVCTTGATLEACAVVLRGAGAASVWGVTLAREP